jgi:hypothetical protein
MKERPILFSGPMIRAILDGSKTMTRRVVKPQPIEVFDMQSMRNQKKGDLFIAPDIMPTSNVRRLVIGHAEGIGTTHWMGSSLFCKEFSPYGQPGDRLWVRETWRPLWDDIDAPGGLGDCVQYRADMAKRKPPLNISEDEGFRFDDMCEADVPQPKWRPSIFMPRWASRFDLPIVNVRLEKLYCISNDDALAEGIWHDDATNQYQCPETKNYFNTARSAYLALSASINGQEHVNSNPWVWVIEFKRVDK